MEEVFTTEVVDEKLLKRLHHLYGHTSAEKLHKFLIKAGRSSDDMKKVLQSIAETCDACTRSKRQKPRPKFAIPRANGPNDIVTIDLKEFDLTHKTRKYICYFIDIFSRLTVTVFIPGKNAEYIVEALLVNWENADATLRNRW